MSMQVSVRDPWVTPEVFTLSSGNEATFGGGKIPIGVEVFIFGDTPNDPDPGDDEQGAS